MIGIDITSIERFQKLSKSNFDEWEKVFTKAEWDYCFGKSNTATHLAGTFAAKEAVMKTLGELFIGHFDKIEIIRLDNGKPVVQIEGESVDISISHDGGMAIAVAIKK